MKCFSQYFLILLILNIQNFLCKKIYLEYNEELDLIEKDGKYYFPISENNLQMKLKNLRIPTQIRRAEEAQAGAEIGSKEPEPCVEEMVTGGTYWFFMFMVAFLTLFAGMMSGLTVGYLSDDQLTMELRENTGTEEEKEASKVILPVLSNRH